MSGSHDVSAADPPLNDDGRRILELLREDVRANIRSDDHAMRDALVQGVARALGQLYPADRPATGGLLDADDAARLALAVWPAAEEFLAEELAHPGHVPTPGSRGPAVSELSARELARHLFRRRGR